MESVGAGGALEDSDLSHSTPTPAWPALTLFPGRKSHPVPGGAGNSWWKERFVDCSKERDNSSGPGVREPHPSPLQPEAPPIPQTTLPTIPSWVVQAAGVAGHSRLNFSPPPPPTGLLPAERGGPPPSHSRSLGTGMGTVLGQDRDPLPCHSWVPPSLRFPTAAGGGAPKHSPPGSCCSACWSGESHCVPGTPASAPRQPPSCGDRKGVVGGRRTWAAGPWEPGLQSRQIHSMRGKSRLWKEKKSGPGPREPRLQEPQISACGPQGCGAYIIPFPPASTDRGLLLGRA